MLSSPASNSAAVTPGHRSACSNLATSSMVVPELTDAEKKAYDRELKATELEIAKKAAVEGTSPQLLMRRAEIYQKLGRLQEAVKDVRRAASLLPATDQQGMDEARDRLVALSQNVSALNIRETPVPLLKTLCDDAATVAERVDCARKLQSLVADDACCRRLAHDCKVATDIMSTRAFHDQAGDAVLLALMTKLVFRVAPYTRAEEAVALLTGSNMLRYRQLLDTDQGAEIVQCVGAMLATVGGNLRPMLDFIHDALRVARKRVVEVATLHLTRSLLSTEAVEQLAEDTQLLLTAAKACEQFSCRPQWTMMLARAWEQAQLDSDAKETWSRAVSKLYQRLMDSEKSCDRVAALNMLAIAFQLNLDFGANILNQDGVLEAIVDCVEMETDAVQVSTLEMLSQACGDKKCRSTIGRVCLDYLEEAAISSNPAIKTAATVVATKIESFASKPDPSHSLEMARQLIVTVKDSKSATELSTAAAVEGLAFLVANPTVKQMIVSDSELLQRLFSLAKKAESTALVYGVAQILTTLSAYRKQKSAEEEQVQRLRVFAKEALPEESDPLDDEPAVQARNTLLIKAGVLGTVRLLAKSESANVQAMAAKIYLNLATDQQQRGLMVQGGAVSGILAITSATIKTPPSYVPFSSAEPLSTVALDASQALAKMAISLDPALAFSTTAASLVRPLVYLAQSERDLQVFESLMALTNLASCAVQSTTRAATDISVHARIMKAFGIRVFQHHQFSDNIMVRRAATEALCNMMAYEPCARQYLDNARRGNGHVKIMMALADADDPATRLAAAASLAILCDVPPADANDTSCNPMGAYLCAQERGLEIVMGLLEDPSDVQLILRGIATVYAMVQYRELADIIVKKRPDVRSCMTRQVKECSHRGTQQTALAILQQLDEYSL